MDFKLAEKETVDPTYLWIGPNEKPLTGNDRINITKTGKLMVKDFLEPLSGLYTCTLSYKTVKAETQEEKMVKQRYDFMIFVNPFAPGWKGTCNGSVDCEDITNHNILQARDRIEEFFRSQAYIFNHDFNKTLPAMHFVDHSFQIWFVVLGLLVPMLMLHVRPAFLSTSTELNLAHKLQKSQHEN